MRLDERLRLAYDLYRDCDLAADIGTDHAHLPIALLRAGKCRRMILTDISDGALNNARDNLIRAGMTDRAELRKGDGLAPIREACGMISVLGMGGRTIRGILEAGKDHLRSAPLLLSAHTDLLHVRRAVSEIGYHIDCETPCLAAGRYYLMIRALPGAEEMTESEFRTGKRLTASDRPVLAGYLQHQYAVQRAKIKGLRSAGTAEAELLQQAEADAAYYQEALRAIGETGMN